MPVKPKKKKTASCPKPATLDPCVLLKALEDHVLGKKEMTASQVSAALALLKKALPEMFETGARKKNAGKAASHEDALELLE